MFILIAIGAPFDRQVYFGKRQQIVALPSRWSNAQELPLVNQSIAAVSSRFTH